MQYRPFFASVCLAAVAAGQDFNIERTMMNRVRHPNPNWIRGFYDEDQLFGHPSEQHHRMPMDDDYERSQFARGFAMIPPSHEEIIMHDPYQRGKAHHKFFAQENELERHERGAFRHEPDSRYFTMHPKRPEYREELDMKV